MSAVRPNVVIEGNELLQMAADRVDVGKVGEIERLILDGLIERFNHGIGESNVLLSDDLFNGYFGQLGVLGPRVGEHEGLCGTLALVDVPTVSLPNRLKLNLRRAREGDRPRGDLPRKVIHHEIDIHQDMIEGTKERHIGMPDLVGSRGSDALGVILPTGSAPDRRETEKPQVLVEG
jgi:hypothetical protein